MHEVFVVPMPLHDPNAPFAAFYTQPTWFRVATPARGRWLHRLQVPPDDPAGDVLADWLVESGARHRLELRLGSSGQHAGVWLGIAGVGVTARLALRNRAEAARHLAAGLQGFGWPATPADPPALPRRRAVLVLDGAVGGADHLTSTRAALDRAAPRGGPLVLRFVFDFEDTRTALVRDTNQMLRQVQARRRQAQRASALWSEEQRAAVEALSSLDRVLDEAASVGLRVAVHGRRDPGMLPLRMLADALSVDLASNASWRLDAPAHRQTAGVGTLRGLIALASARPGEPTAAADPRVGAVMVTRHFMI